MIVISFLFSSSSIIYIFLSVRYMKKLNMCVVHIFQESRVTMSLSPFVRHVQFSKAKIFFFRQKFHRQQLLMILIYIQSNQQSHLMRPRGTCCWVMEQQEGAISILNLRMNMCLSIHYQDNDFSVRVKKISHFLVPSPPCFPMNHCPLTACQKLPISGLECPNIAHQTPCVFVMTPSWCCYENNFRCSFIDVASVSASQLRFLSITKLTILLPTSQFYSLLLFPCSQKVVENSSNISIVMLRVVFSSDGILKMRCASLTKFYAKYQYF